MSRQVVITCEHGDATRHADIRYDPMFWCEDQTPLDLAALPAHAVEAAARLLADRDTVLLEDAPEVYLPLAEAVVHAFLAALTEGP